MQKKDIGLGAVSTLFGAWVFYSATGMKAGAAFWPKVVGGGIILLGAIILVLALLDIKKQDSKVQERKKPKEKPKYGAVAAITAVLFAYYFVFQYVGYTIPTALLIGGSAFLLGYRNLKVLIPTSLAISVGLYLSFSQLFGIRFPGLFF